MKHFVIVATFTGLPSQAPMYFLLSASRRGGRELFVPTPA